MKSFKLRRALYSSKLYLKRSAPTIMTCTAAVGVVATAVLTVKATPKATELLKEVSDAKGEELTKLETVQIAGPCYIPAAAVGLATILCIFGSNALNRKQQASIMSAYTMLSESFKQYRNTAKSVYGDDADKKITEAAKDVYVSADGCIYDPSLDQDSEKVLFYERNSQRYFTSTMASVINAEYHLNRNLMLRGYASLNEFYEFLGIEKIDGWDTVGWSMDELLEMGIQWLDFDNTFVKMDDGLECYVIAALYCDPTPFPD